MFFLLKMYWGNVFFTKNALGQRFLYTGAMFFIHQGNVFYTQGQCFLTKSAALECSISGT